MPTCAAGHNSTDDEYCDVCGIRMSAAPPSGSVGRLPPPTGPSMAFPPPVDPGGAPAPEGGVCADCQFPVTGRFCEACGRDHNSTAPPKPQVPEPAPEPPPVPPVPPVADTGGPQVPAQARSQPSNPITGSWTAVVTADLAYYRSQVDRGELDPGAIAFPPYSPQRQVPMYGSRIHIGRGSRSRGISPEIDLATPPEDPAVSHMHAVLIAKPDGSWALVDPGSANGTMLNGSPDLVPVNTEIPVNDRDRIYVGAWTVITLRRG
ncbi:FHA domain-containing protein [Murinocardiopsis flavida]|uniref:FHA domain-containing protein n=1 Tax=Murinocardiopsis flavida TaxID=645275 RepID=A0A2P8DGH9_9ACTN|nr:FHA domain-containing protein [Murinocardiopsis flavida]PSK96296.1 FHA domain-containing protein [Murinocardiopsis flavida]